jgi:hypothetical protein
MSVYYNKQSFGIVFNFYDIDNRLIKPETLTYKIINRVTNEIIRTDTITPQTSTYTIQITTEDNTINSNIEKRKIIVEWDYNNGKDGDVFVYPYDIIQP